MVIDEMRRMYYSTWKPEPIKCDVAIHIRRGDVGRIDNHGRKNSDGNNPLDRKTPLIYLFPF